MIDDDKESADQILAPRASTAPVDRASESVVSPRDHENARASVVPSPLKPISSGSIEIPRDSLLPASEVSSLVPPSTIVSNAMERGRPVLPLSTIVLIGCGVFVVLVALSLLLFR